MSEPSISIRRYIRWGNAPPSEPTSTLVLTSSRRRFTDTRILRPRHGPGSCYNPNYSHHHPAPGIAAAADALPNTGGPVAALDWAFAGTSSATPLPPDPANELPRAYGRWVHEIDSRVPSSSFSTPELPEPDEGEMTMLPDGQCVERGVMTHPDTGVPTAYEECWIDAEPAVVGQDDDGAEGRPTEKGKVKACVVLELDDPEHRARGMVVRVGQYCQGVLKVGPDTDVERWEYMGDKAGPEGGVTADGKVVPTMGESGKQWGWQRVVKIGGKFMPCSVAFKPNEIREGDVVNYGSYHWKVTEKYQWE